MEQGKIEFGPPADETEDPPVKTEAELIAAWHLVKAQIHIIDAGMEHKVKSLEMDTERLVKLNAKKQWLEGQLPTPPEADINPAE